MRIPAKLPGRLGIRGGPPIFEGGTASYDYSIDEMPFLSAASNAEYGNRKIRRETAPFRKQQFDNEPNPGEQSLSGYWLRSSQSFHGGAGMRFSDPSEDNPKSEIRFWASRGVDVWQQGQVTLLHDASRTEADVPGVKDVAGFFTAGAVPFAVVGYLRASRVGYVRDLTGSVTEGAWSAGVPMSITSNGTDLFVVSTTGVYRAPIPMYGALPGSWTQIYNGVGVSTTAVLRWVKERLILGTGINLYELAPYPTTPPVALPTPIYVSLSPDWHWTSITETTSAIYAVGQANSTSTILKFTLETTGGTTALSGGAEAATLPGGEVAYTVFGYLGSFVGIGTNKGARVAVADNEGNLTYGPLIYESDQPVTSFTGRDRFLYGTYYDTDNVGIKLARIDLSNEIQGLRFAYATDLQIDDEFDFTPARHVAFFPGTDNLFFTTDDFGWYEHADRLTPSGWLQSARIRYNTLEPKNFRSFRVRSPRLDGSLGISTVDVNGVVTPVHVYGVDQTAGQTDVTMTLGGPQDYISLLFTLAYGGETDPTVGAIMNGWQVKALPGSPRQRLVTLPIWCFDFETDKFGVRVGGNLTAIQRITNLENREDQGTLVVYHDFDQGVTNDAFIEELKFEQADPPTRFRGWGGIITITLRLL